VRRKIPPRRSLRESLLESRRGLEHYAILSGRPTPPEFRQIAVPPEPKKRKPAGANGKPLERDVLKRIIVALRADPRVALVQRNQSGVFQEGNRYIRVGSRGLLDLTVYLHGGRFAEIEVKRPGGKPEPHQAERIATIRANGGIAGYATSPAEALALLP
jgi:hypothetical protein